MKRINSIGILMLSIAMVVSQEASAFSMIGSQITCRKLEIEKNNKGKLSGSPSFETSFIKHTTENGYRVD